MIFIAGKHQFDFPRPAMVMGIVNVTPDSFSDGGRFLEPELAVEHAELLVREGADILDIGGESTRPGSRSVDEKEELRRVIPVIEMLRSRVAIPISIDTMKPVVANAALRAGACLVNDVGASREDPLMWKIVAEAGAGYVLMHSQGTPEKMQDAPFYENVAQDVHSFFECRLEGLGKAGVDSKNVILDVGIGFGKSVGHNLALLAGLESFTDLGRPLLLGVSRKSLISKATGCGDQERLSGSLACTVQAALAGVQIFRTHDVLQTRQALRMTEAIVAAR